MEQQTEGHGHRVAVRRAPSCSHHQVAQVPQEDGLRHHQEVEGVRVSKRKEHKPRSDRICTPKFVAGLKRSIKAIRDAHVHPRQEAWGTPVVVPWMDSVASGIPYIFQQDSVPAPRPNLCSPG
ncbi:Uncharacterized protein FKW44_013045 [Caligus rogercresseyi]|uniref:Uncharacterized protein n=1 Tax=Caligus rogercresseyi TaxID=217165 RepID=A0A7T8KB53_CALRO|nr:Uncharacterized protein FKW44_013045 [Caligus rogercresseyi]